MFGNNLAEFIRTVQVMITAEWYTQNICSKKIKLLFKRVYNIENGLLN